MITVKNIDGSGIDHVGEFMGIARRELAEFQRNETVRQYLLGLDPGIAYFKILINGVESCFDPRKYMMSSDLTVLIWKT